MEYGKEVAERAVPSATASSVVVVLNRPPDNKSKLSNGYQGIIHTRVLLPECRRLNKHTYPIVISAAAAPAPAAPAAAESAAAASTAAAPAAGAAALLATAVTTVLTSGGGTDIASFVIS